METNDKARMEELHTIFEEELEELEALETEEIRKLAHGYIGRASRQTLTQIVTEMREDYWW